MKNDSIPYPVMAGLYRTAVAVSALILSSSLAYAADPPVPRSNVSVNVNPTTGYYSTNNTTLRLPNGVSASAATTSSGLPVVTKYPNGLQQSLPTGITINAIKKSAPLPVVVRASTNSLKRAATGCLTSARCNIALLAAGEGLNQLFNGLGWIMGDGGKIQKIPDDNGIYQGIPEGYTETANASQRSSSTVCPPRANETCVHTIFRAPDRPFDNHMNYYCSNTVRSQPLTGYQPIWSCYYGGTKPAPTPVPVSDTDIASGVQNNYIPEPSDWRALMPKLDLDDVEITRAPTLQGEPKTTTEYDADGNPHRIRETNIWYDFDIRDNPSPQPKVDLKTREETKTFEDGVLTGTTTTEITNSAGSDDTPPPPEPPIDCDLFPTACAWFEWTKEEPVEPDDDLSPLLQEVPIVSETYTITGGVAACPAPLVLDLSVFGTREVSYQPLCDLASTMKFLYLALMSFAAAVLLHRSINRV